MRILIFTDAWSPQVNGVVRTLTTTVAKLQESGHGVSVVSPNDFLCIPHKLTKWMYPDVTFSVPPILKVSRIISDFKPDCIHISTEGPIGWAAWLICLIKGIKFTTTYHTKFPEYIKKRFYIPMFVGYAYEKMFHNRSFRTMVATQSLRVELENRGFKHLAFWERGVDTDFFHHSRRDDDLFPIQHRPIALFFGRVSKEKNIEAFLEAEWKGTKYVVGDGPQLASLKAKYPSAIFVGKKIGTLASYVASADITVFPSKTDTYGLTIIESMACGTPVAAYDVTGPRDIIISGQTGCISYKEDLSDAMSDALNVNRNECRRFAETKTWDVCTEQFAKNLIEAYAI